jgi:hypothetical protein
VKRAFPLALGLLLLASASWSQSAQIQVAPAPHYVGEQIRMLVSIEGFEEETTPEVELGEPAGGELSIAGMSPSVSQSISIVNGNVTRTREVSFILDLRFQPRRPGLTTIGPMRFVQGDRAVVVRAFQLEIQTPATRGDLALELELPKRPVYVGERAPVTLRLRLASQLQRDMEDYTLEVPLFDENVPFQFLDSVQESDTQLVVTTKSGRLPLGAMARQSGGDVIIEATRTLVPLSAGIHEVEPATLQLSEGVAFQRGLLGGRRATRVRKWSTESPARTLEVKQIPDEGRPPSFGGTVGRGFTLAVTADRSVVRVGDPITLSIDLRGEGLETAALPSLDREGMLAGSDFHVPVGEVVGEREGDVKRFHAVVRVKDASVAGIPALAFSWFNPESERFETTHSRPIALSVSEGQVVGAGDVARAPSEQPEPSLPERPDSEPSRRVVTTAADLSIERAPERLMRSEGGSLGGLGAQGVCYAGGVLVVLLAWVDRRRRDEDPALRARRERLGELLGRVDGAQTLTSDAALDALADALRRIRAEAPGADGAELDALVGECEAARYAPGATTLDAALVERAAQAARRFVEALS